MNGVFLGPKKHAENHSCEKTEWDPDIIFQHPKLPRCLAVPGWDQRKVRIISGKNLFFFAKIMVNNLWTLT